MARFFRLLLVLLGGALLSAAVGGLAGRAQVPDTARNGVEQERRAWPDEPLAHPALPDEADTTDADTTEKDAPYVPTPREVVVRMLEAADVSADDVVYDLGSGDGRIPILAAERFGARGVGVEIDSQLVAQSRTSAREAGVGDRVEFRRQDFFKTDLGEATVVALYLWPEINLKLRPKLLRELDPGDQIVSHDFSMGEWAPDRRIEMDSGGIMGSDVVYLWTVPKEVPDRLLKVPPKAQDE